MPRSLAPPADPRHLTFLRLLCFGFCIFDSIAVCFVGLDEAVSSFRECGLSYGLCDACVRFNRFVRWLTHLLTTATLGMSGWLDLNSIGTWHPIRNIKLCLAHRRLSAVGSTINL